MRRVGLMIMFVLATSACGSDGGSDSSLGLSGAAAAAQRAIDEGDDLGDCPWDQQAVVDAVTPVVGLVPEFATLDRSNGQVFSGGEVDITYCEIWPDESTTATDGIESFRIDVHPGKADLQQYLDEEVGGEASDAESSKMLGGTVRSLCLEADRCIATWQGDGLFVTLITSGVAAATAPDAVDALKAAIPVVVAGLAA